MLLAHSSPYSQRNSQSRDLTKSDLFTLGRSAVHTGGVGAGGVAKLVNNMIVGAAFAAIAEGFGLAERNGVDPLRLYAIREGWASGKVLDVAAPAIAARSYVPGGTIDLLEKDLSYPRTLAMECRSPIPLTAAAHEVLVAGQSAGHGRESQPALFELYRGGPARR